MNSSPPSKPPDPQKSPGTPIEPSLKNSEKYGRMTPHGKRNKIVPYTENPEGEDNPQTKSMGVVSKYIKYERRQNNNFKPSVYEEEELGFDEVSSSHNKLVMKSLQKSSNQSSQVLYEGKENNRYAESKHEKVFEEDKHTEQSR